MALQSAYATRHTKKQTERGILRAIIKGVKKIIAAILLGVSLSASGCAVTGIRLTARDHDRTVDAKTRQTITVSLQSNMTTGYCWNLASTPDTGVIKLVSSTYRTPKRGLMGAGGIEVWKFRAAGPGTAAITLAYARPWEKDKPPAREFRVTVRVR